MQFRCGAGLCRPRCSTFLRAGPRGPPRHRKVGTIDIPFLLHAESLTNFDNEFCRLEAQPEGLARGGLPQNPGPGLAL
eukprot:3816006-Heterocapsa_arctica.AAC.1